MAQGLLNNDFIFDPGAESLKGGAYTLRWWRDDFYTWKLGCWFRMSDSEMKRIVTNHIQTLNETVLDSDQEISVTTTRVNNILLCLSSTTRTPEQIELNTWHDGREKLYYTISVKNGFLMLRQNQQEPPTPVEHTPNFFNLVQLPYEYDPKAKCPRWGQFLDDVMQGNQDYILLLQQWAGYLFRPDLREQKFLLCAGEGANGKGVLFDVIQGLVGKDNCSEVGLTRFNNPFALYGTLGKIVNATNESSHIIEDEAENILKSFVAGDKFTFERKFKEPLTNVVPTAKVMIATNALPRWNDKTQGIWRRMLFVPFDKVIPEEVQIKDLAKRIQSELPGILNWALLGLQKLNEAGGFTIPANSKELMEEYRKDADPARAFLLDSYITTTNRDSTACEDVYRSYKEYCDQNNCRPMNGRTFGRHVNRIFPDVKRVRVGPRESRQYRYERLVSYENGNLIGHGAENQNEKNGDNETETETLPF